LFWTQSRSHIELKTWALTSVDRKNVCRHFCWARIENKDIGLVQSGQLVEVKVDAYDFTKYGLATGRIRTLSRDAVSPQEATADNPAAAREIPEPVYMARILLDSNDLGKAKRSLFPGMGVTAEIKIGRRRIIDYLLSPIMEHAHDSLREI
jgi:hemolysin D